MGARIHRRVLLASCCHCRVAVARRHGLPLASLRTRTGSPASGAVERRPGRALARGQLGADGPRSRSRTQCVLVLPVCPPWPHRRAVYAELFVGAGPAEIEGSGRIKAGAGAILLPPAELAGRSTD